MRRRTAVLLMIGLAVTYVGSYLYQSRRGVYVPRAFGAAKGPHGGMVLRSKGFGKIWQPFGLARSQVEYDAAKIREMVYSPLIFIDERVWHRMQPETEESYYSDYF